MQNFPKLNQSNSTLFLFYLSAILFMLSITSEYALAEQDATKNTPSKVTVLVNKSQGIYLHAMHESLNHIFKTLSAKTGVNIHYSSLPDSPVTAHCFGQDVKAVVECLLGPGTSLIARVVGDNPLAEPTYPETVEYWLLSIPSGVEHNLPKAISTKTAKIKLMERDLKQFDDTIKQTRSKDAEQRAMAVYNLGLLAQKEDAEVIGVLRDALSDNDQNVRTQAATSLSRLAVNEPGAELNPQPGNRESDNRLPEDNALKEKLDLLQQATKNGNLSAISSINGLLPEDSRLEQ